ncbi:YihA family ribosome biogenesis GTP-binding protein [Hydrogenovibrio sp. SC-1]|uniref:ribosome biogenesis GTP-binding protein YihA/YsxC n=1 Tax=Hydrogenovibrio sp. SC-1 TaxID=2065820 RepID=UPI000C7DDE83|nr:ribosome biogenesis GTP-binding protein YihA/YsxC [Hydrogenovibrio sp. SC-1]PLA75339.1 YihA family ribosome biogenesis GTP-binding protein [Hydrogenovibrio sp. SC-1]
MQHPLYQQAHYLKSAPNLNHCPVDEGIEVAFAGRSNAGKSSALNVITSQKSLAKTSKTPGRTQLINFFECDEQRKLVDLPGYGYAKVNIATKRNWEQSLSEYIEKRAALRGLVMMVDCRMPPTDIDLTLLDWTLSLDLPVHVLLTKSDKLKKGPAQNSLLKFRQLLDELYPHASAQLFSSLKRQGLEEVWAKLDEWMDYQRPEKVKK